MNRLEQQVIESQLGSINTRIELRDKFAMAALQGVMSFETCKKLNHEEIAQISYSQAEAMLKAREKYAKKDAKEMEEIVNGVISGLESDLAHKESLGKSKFQERLHNMKKQRDEQD